MTNEEIIQDTLIFAKTLNKEYESPNHQAMIEAIIRKALSNKSEGPLSFLDDIPQVKAVFSQFENIFKK